MSKYKQQWYVLTILFMAWGIIGLARNAINYLFPYVQAEFGLSSSHMGFLSATLAVFWAIAIILTGKYYHKIGAMKLTIPGFVLSALATGFLGMTTHVVFLYVCVALVGLGAGAICTPSFSLLAEHSDPQKRGMFMGVMQSSFQLIGVAGGSVLLSYLGNASGWRGSYLFLGFIFLAFAVLFFVSLRMLDKREYQGRVAKSVAPAPQKQAMKDNISAKEIFRSRNMKIASIATCFCMIWSFTVTAYTILYLIEARGFSAVTAGIIFSGFGLGGFLGNILGATLSDFLGRKPSIAFCCLCNVFFFMTFLNVDASPIMLMFLLFASSFFYSGMSPIVVTVVPSEAVEPHMIAKATSFTPSIGEIFGGVLAPVLAGICLSTLPIDKIMWVLAFVPLVIFGLSLLLDETAPRAVARKKVSKPSTVA